MPQDPKDVETAKKIAPACKAFTEAITAAGLEVSALVWDKEGDFLIKVANVERTGSELVRLHYFLSLVIANLDAMGERRDMSDFTDTSAVAGQVPTEIAHRLALAAITVPSEMIPDRVRALAEEYLKSVGEN